MRRPVSSTSNIETADRPITSTSSVVKPLWTSTLSITSWNKIGEIRPSNCMKNEASSTSAKIQR
ncbi:MULTISPECIES: hypothetical protein [unclassified Mesorhizobium]|uniref:hypothetical protein n=1 Tax=unclassified Mesorhizobium TaxID=325217 RepID=UPI001FE242CA|nr:MULTISPECIES: hypothetical protein [unclassified Mesorhizobium]